MISRNTRTFAPLDKERVAKVCLNTWGETFTPAMSALVANLLKNCWILLIGIGSPSDDGNKYGESVSHNAGR